jgi:hypothetical protein
MSKRKGLKFATLKFRHLKAIFIYLMGLHGGHLIKGCNLLKHYLDLVKRKGVKRLVGTRSKLYTK